MRKMLSSVTVIGALVLAVGAMAASASTGYTLFGTAQIVLPGNGSADAVEAVVADGSQYGGVDFSFPAGLTLSGVNHLSTDLKASVGTCATGTPRFAVGVDDGTATAKYVFFYPTCSSDWSGSGNLASPTSLVDATQLGGGFYEPYATVQADYGTDPVTDIFLVADASNGVQTVQFDNSQVNDVTYSYERCMPTGFVKDGIDLTAAQIGGSVTGDLDATGCNIGVYYDALHPATGNNISGANIFGANYFGVVNNGTGVNVTNTSIHNIGEVPFNGSQHGVAVYYTGSTASGTISGNTIEQYQKGGITISNDAIATITGNTVTGLGSIDFIAQNGIQVSYGASATVTGNTVTNNDYTPKAWTACGILFYQATGVKQSANKFAGNEANICNAGRGGGNARP